MEEYESYCLIQKHMNISEDLYNIDKIGKHVLTEIQEKKNTKQNGRRGYKFSEEYEIIYNSIYDTINVCRFKSRLYLSLLYYLDEVLFNNIPDDHDAFYIEDDRYDLTKLYFDQEYWVRHIGIQTFSLPHVDSSSFTMDEALLINCFFSKYESLLKDILAILVDIPDEASYKKKIVNVIGRIRSKHNTALQIIMDTVNKDQDFATKIESGLKDDSP